jgi:hypothetical protein
VVFRERKLNRSMKAEYVHASVRGRRYKKKLLRNIDNFHETL